MGKLAFFIEKMCPRGPRSVGGSTTGSVCWQLQGPSALEGSRLHAVGGNLPKPFCPPGALKSPHGKLRLPRSGTEKAIVSAGKKQLQISTGPGQDGRNEGMLEVSPGKRPEIAKVASIIQPALGVFGDHTRRVEEGQEGGLSWDQAQSSFPARQAAIGAQRPVSSGERGV